MNKYMVICHSYYHKKYAFIKNYRKNIYLDENIESKPDICMNILDTSQLHRYNRLKNTISEITSVYAPIDIFFTKDIYYPDFKNLCANKISTRFVKENVRFNVKFLNFILYFLRPGGSMTFTDNFIFFKNKISKCTAKRLIHFFLGRKKKYFKVSITNKSRIIDIEKKYEKTNRYQHIVSLTKK
jgi:hypothetical protein